MTEIVIINRYIKILCISDVHITANNDDIYAAVALINIIRLQITNVRWSFHVL